MLIEKSADDILFNYILIIFARDLEKNYYARFFSMNPMNLVSSTNFDRTVSFFFI